MTLLEPTTEQAATLLELCSVASYLKDNTSASNAEVTQLVQAYCSLRAAHMQREDADRLIKKLVEIAQCLANMGPI